jgi:hypothetical protein
MVTDDTAWDDEEKHASRFFNFSRALSSICTGEIGLLALHCSSNRQRRGSINSSSVFFFVSAHENFFLC